MDKNTEKIWKEFHNKLKQFILLRVTNKDDANDILQEVFIKIYKNIATLKEQQKLTSWIYQITRNTIIDYYRVKKDMYEFDEELFEDNVLEEEAVKKISPSLSDMITLLPPIYREAIILTEYNGMKQRELAGKLGISLTGAKSRVQRARQQLKEMLMDCCDFEFDSAGKMSDYSKKVNCCSNFTELKKNITPAQNCNKPSQKCN